MSTPPAVLTTIGIQPATEFPSEPYETIHSLVTKHKDTNPDSWGQYAGSWNAIGYRFKTCTEHDEAFTNSVKKVGSSPPQPERYIQERELFGFFATGLSTMETLYYGLFAIASIIHPDKFPFSVPNDFRRVSLAFTTKSFNDHFVAEPITSVLQSVIDSKQFSEWNEVRNILVHRALPGRTHYAGGELDGKTLWNVGISIDVNTTSVRRKWLSSVLNDVLKPAAEFCQKYL